MSNETTENFLKVMATFEWPDPAQVCFRLYYNDDGSPKCYTMEDFPGKYIEVDSHTFALRPCNVKVINETLQYIEPGITVKKLKPTQQTGTTCHPTNICIVVDAKKSHTKWKLTTHDTH